MKELSDTFPENEKIVTVVEARMLVTLAHIRAICQVQSPLLSHHSFLISSPLQSWFDGVNYIENLLHQQLVAAIGKEVTSVDLSQYMCYHNRKIFKEE